METKAFCLTYDGTVAEQLPAVLNDLSENGLVATFFVNAPTVLRTPDLWRSVAQAGHEIGNASHYGVTDNGRLPNWTLKMVEQDLFMTNQFLTEFFGTPTTSFAYAGHHSCVADGADYGFVVNQIFLRARLMPGDQAQHGIASMDSDDFSLERGGVIRFGPIETDAERDRHAEICRALRGQKVDRFRDWIGR